MFTGLVQDIGEIRRVDHANGGVRLEIGVGASGARGLGAGASVSCNGCCLTVTEYGADWFAADVSAETLGKTAISEWRLGQKINIEPSLHLGDPLGGHFVFGHIDGLAHLEEIRKDGSSRRLKLSLQPDLMIFVASKGSVCLDGVSLTVNDVEQSRFGVNIIPQTWEATTFQSLKTGDKLHFEADMLARYVARQAGFSIPGSYVA